MPTTLQLWPSAGAGVCEQTADLINYLCVILFCWLIKIFLSLYIYMYIHTCIANEKTLLAPSLMYKIPPNPTLCVTV